MFNRYKLGAATVALLLAAAPAAVYAQQTTAALRGVVTNATGVPVANATVTIVHTPSGTRAVSRTDAEGRYDVSGLKVGGPYEVDVAANGHTPSRSDGVFLALGDQQKLDIVMDEPTTTVTVVGRRSTLSNPGSRTRMNREDLGNVVTYKRDIREAARRDPLTQLDANTRGTGPTGGLYIAGSAPRANRITIDGVRSSDDFGLNTGGLSTNLGPISIEAVDQMTVQAVPADVEEGDFTGGALNIVLRSGTNDFHGSVFTYLRNKAWNGRELYNPVTKATNKVKLFVPDENYGAFVSGPILKDTLFFALSYEKYTSASVVAAGPAGAGFGTELRNGGVPFTQADIDALLAPWATYAASSNLNPGSIPLTTPFEDEKYSAKIDWNIMEGQRASFTYRHAFSEVWKGSPASSAALNLNTNWYTQPENEDNYALQLNSKWSDNLSTEARLAWRNYQRGQMPPVGQGFSAVSVCSDATSAGAINACTINRLTLNFGPDQFRQANVLKTTNNSASFTGTYRTGGHAIKGGYQGKQIGIYNLFVQGANGVYYFDSKKSFEDSRVDQLFYNNNPTGDKSKAAADFSYMNHTLFIQDTFDPWTNTTVNYGLRYDFWTQDDQPALNPNFTARNGYSNQGNYDGLSVLQPRAGIKWHNDVLDASASFGLYTGGLPDVFISNRFGNTGILTATFTLQRQLDGTFRETNSGTTFAANDATVSALMNINKADATFAAGVPSSGTSLLSLNPGLVRVANTNSLASGFDMPSDWKLNLATHYTTPFGTVLGIDAVLVRSNTGLAFRDVRARRLTLNGVQQYTPDGRIRYDGLVVASTAPSGSSQVVNNQSIYANRTTAGLGVGTNADGSALYDLANPGSGYDIQAYNPEIESSSETIAFSAQQSFDGVIWDRDHLDLFAAYTHQRTNQYGGVPEFATTDCCGGSNYGDQFSSEDPNAPTRGKSSFEIYRGVKLNATYEVEWFKDARTSFTLFGDIRDGRPLNFYMQDAGSAARGQVFGVVSGNQLAFIPQTESAIAGSNGLGFMTGSVPVYFTNATELANLQKLVTQFDLPTGILPKGVSRNPSIQRFDLHIAQDLPMPWFDGHKVVMTVDIFNLGNLLNKKWGTVAEYGVDGRQGTPMFRVACGDAAGNAVTGASPVCASYRISGVSTTLTTPTVNQAATLNSVMVGLKYSF
ncbi:TonB-dependent receptor [Asticcacaulis sp. AC402]|uniref:TonB-dependent receptor n=1 Tax=Asticcacaulis sp. AC402 TaxID=1282361 RepID=UPI0003C3F0F4|nr:TonB-dependent receptor [Asticcacaulis sp. AC402]ESQ77593.1 hypothetical protein ABAC402_00255 [Asticcacaulis sp. AC402]